jgi:hypothetical protein
MVSANRFHILLITFRIAIQLMALQGSDIRYVTNNARCGSSSKTQKLPANYLLPKRLRAWTLRNAWRCTISLVKGKATSTVLCLCMPEYA